MQADIAVGLFTIALSVLGGIVSAHAPHRFSQKCLYVAGFVLLAVFGLFFVFRLSNETAVANAKLSDAVSKLRELTSHWPPNVPDYRRAGQEQRTPEGAPSSERPYELSFQRGFGSGYWG